MIESKEFRVLGEQFDRVFAVRNVRPPRCDHANAIEVMCEGARCAACGKQFSEHELSALVEAARALR